MRAVRAALPVLLLLAACHCPGHVSTPVGVFVNSSYVAPLIEISSESTPPITPGHSIRLPGKGVGTWKEISLSRPRGNNARYSDPDRSSSNTFKASNMWITTLLVAWTSLSGIMNIITPSR
ncbi:hypothetical protein R5R35_006070 [Gryllus longicercus]|uniref:Accessory gland protein n=1 Tax=Gryllus longicercus TaxID=2509291 RepID=A0AAN9WD87_9ORTH